MKKLKRIWIIILIIQRNLDSTFIVYSAVLTTLILVRHRSNIERLVAGVERRFGEPA